MRVPWPNSTRELIIETSQTDDMSLCRLQLLISWSLFSGTIHGHARSLYEERAGLRPRLLDHRPVDLQRLAGPEGADPQSQGKAAAMFFPGPLLRNSPKVDLMTTIAISIVFLGDWGIFVSQKPRKVAIFTRGSR